MAKFLLVWTLFLTICWFTVVSGEIENEGGLKKFIANRVIPTFRTWAKNGGRDQFAVLMLMNTDHEWNTAFDFSPTPTTTFTSIVQPKKSDMNNYVAAIPGKLNNNDQFMHSEQRIYEKYLKEIYANYKSKNRGRAPKAMVLYSWIVPCQSKSCVREGTGCTEHTIKALKEYNTKETQVIVAYTTNGGSGSKYYKCDHEKTKKELKNKGIDVIKVKYRTEEEQEAMMESLIKLGRLLQILE